MPSRLKTLAVLNVAELKRKQYPFCFVCFDKFERIAYGFRTIDEKKLDLVKFSLFTADTEKVVAKLRFRFPEDLEFSDCFLFAANKNRNVIAIGQSVFNGFRENGEKCSFLFHLFTINTGTLKTYYVEENEKNSEFNCLQKIFSCHANTWIIRCISSSTGFNPSVSQFYQLILDDSSGTAYLQSLTTFNADHRKEPIVEDSTDEFLINTFDLKCFNVYDFGLNTWTQKHATNAPTKDVTNFGSDVNNLYAVCCDDDVLLRCDFNAWEWTVMEEGIQTSDLSILPEKGLASSDLLVVAYQDIMESAVDFDEDIDMDDPDIDDENDTATKRYYVYSLKKMLSLRDIAVVRLVRSNKQCFAAHSEAEFCQLSGIPVILEQQYFGPQWTLSNTVPRVSCQVLLSPRDRDDTDDADSDESDSISD